MGLDKNQEWNRTGWNGDFLIKKKDAKNSSMCWTNIPTVFQTSNSMNITPSLIIAPKPDQINNTHVTGEDGCNKPQIICTNYSHTRSEQKIDITESSLELRFLSRITQPNSFDPIQLQGNNGTGHKTPPCGTIFGYPG